MFRFWHKKVLANDYPAVISKRFQVYFSALEECHDELTLPQLAEALGYPDTQFLHRLSEGVEVIPFGELDDFCRRAMIYPEWLKHGDFGTWVSYDEGEKMNPYDTLEWLNEEWPERLGFIRSDSETGEVILVGQFDECRWKVYPMAVHFSNKVGATEQGQLADFYRFADYIKKDYSNNCVAFGRTIPDALFQKMQSGKIFPGTHFHYAGKNDYWWMDFTCLGEDGSQHGEQFKQAMATILDFAEHDKYFKAFLDGGGHKSPLDK